MVYKSARKNIHGERDGWSDSYHWGRNNVSRGNRSINSWGMRKRFIIIIIHSLTAKVVAAPQMISQPVSSIFPCSPLPSVTWRTPGLSIPWYCLPTCFSVCLVFFPLSLCPARWFWSDLINRRHDHTNFELQEYFPQFQDTTDVLLCHIHLSVCLWIMDPLQQSSREEYKPWKWDATARYYASHTKTMLRTKKSVPRSSRQSDHKKTSWPP